ncbi:MAG: hypothetical protein ACRDOI_28990 [Trebonia sp.]
MESHEGPGCPAAAMAPGDAASAISAIDGRRSWLADRIIAPRWFHLAFGLLAGGAIAEAEIRSWVLLGWSVAAYTAGCGALMWWNQRRVGVAMEYFDACTRAVFAAHVLALSGLIAAACWLGLDRGTHGAFLAAGALAVPLTVAFGRWTDRLLRARLRASR